MGESVLGADFVAARGENRNFVRLDAAISSSESLMTRSRLRGR